MSELSIGRTLSLIVAAVYLLVAGLSAPSIRELVAALLILSGYMLIPLACIWFGDELGEYVGTLPGPSINRKSPGCMVKVGGWVLLLFPVIIIGIRFIS